MDEENSIIGLITANIVTTFNGMIIPYDGIDNTANCDFERSECHFDTFPAIEVSPPVSRVLSTSSRTVHREAKYDIFCYVNNIDDQWDSVTQKFALTKTLRNIPSYLVKEIMKDIKRGNNASITSVGDIGQCFVPGIGNDTVWLLSYIEVMVQYFEDQFNPFVKVG